MILPRTLHLGALLALLLGLALALAGPARAQAVPLDDAGFAQVAAQRLQSELPGYRIVPAARPLTLEGTRPDGDSAGQMSLDRVHAFCQRNVAHCSAALDQYAKGVAEAVKERDRPLDKGMVRVAVRSAEYVEALKKQLGPGAAALISRPLPGGLAAVAVLDFTRSMRFAGAGDLPKLGLGEDALFAAGEANLRASIRPLAEVAPVPGPQALGSITDEDYASSRILFHADWRALSEKLDHQLVVMVPAPDILLYGNGATAQGLDALRALGRDLARRAPRPLSTVVLKWTPAGWQALP